MVWKVVKPVTSKFSGVGLRAGEPFVGDDWRLLCSWGFHLSLEALCHLKSYLDTVCLEFEFRSYSLDKKSLCLIPVLSQTAGE